MGETFGVWETGELLFLVASTEWRGFIKGNSYTKKMTNWGSVWATGTIIIKCWSS